MNKWLIVSSFPHLPTQSNESHGTTPRWIKLSFVGVLLVKILEANNNTFSGTILFQVIWEWIWLLVCLVSSKDMIITFDRVSSTKLWDQTHLSTTFSCKRITSNKSSSHTKRCLLYRHRSQPPIHVFASLLMSHYYQHSNKKYK